MSGMIEKMRRYRACLCAGSAAAVLLAGHGEALAQASTNSTGLETVVVTAEKETGLASRTPLALSVLSGDTLKDQGATTISDIQNITPSVIIGRDNFGVNISIRGVTSTDNTSKGDEGIAFNVDGIPIGRPVEEGLALFDVSRIEVLRGPQGTLYGKSSTGGAINVITNRPTDSFQATADMDAGNYDSRRENFMVNVPVSDKLYLRVAASANDRDGYLHPSLGSLPVGQDTNDQHDLSGRVSALYTLSDSTSLLVAVTGGHVGGVGSGTALFNRVLNQDGDAQRQIYGNPFQPRINENFLNLNGEFNSDLGFATLTYDGAYLTFNQHDMTTSGNDPRGNNGGNYNWRDYHGRFRTDSQELRLSHSGGGWLDWVTGINYYDEQIHESDHNWSAPVATPTYAASTNGIDPVNATSHESYSVFGQATAHLNDIFSIVGGLREGKDSLVRVGTFAAGPFDRNGVKCTPFADCIGGPNNGKEGASKLTYRVGVNAQINPDDLIYASVATGYKAGGFNDFDPTTGGTGAYVPESMTAYELGYKGLIGPDLSLTSAVYYYDYSSEQISSLVNVVGNFVIFTRGVPTILYGWEAEGRYRLGPDDSIDFGLTTEHSEYSAFKAGLLQNVNWAGYGLDRTPSLVVTAGYNHHWELGSMGSVDARVNTKFNGNYHLSDFVSAIQYTQHSFTRTDLLLTYTTSDSRFYGEIYARNLEDNIQATGGGGGFTAGVPDAAGVAVNEPRMIGVRIGVKY